MSPVENQPDPVPFQQSLATFFTQESSRKSFRLLRTSGKGHLRKFDSKGEGNEGKKSVCWRGYVLQRDGTLVGKAVGKGRKFDLRNPY